MKRALLASAAMAVLMLNPAHAASDAEVLAELKAMRAEMSRMQNKVETLEEQLKITSARARQAETKAITADFKASETKVSLSPGPKFESYDGRTSFRVGGFGQADIGWFSDDVRDHPDGTNLRRARINVSGTINKDWRYKLENDFANNVSALTDAYVEYAGFDPIWITVGQFKEPFSLETLTSDLFTTFSERALPTAFSPDRKIGVGISTRGSGSIGAYTAAAGWFGAGTGTASTNDEAQDYTGRVTLAPILETDKLLHLGIAGSHRIPDQTAPRNFRISSRAENNLMSSMAVDTGNVSNVDYVNLVGLEAAAVWGPASLQGEYMRADMTRRGALSDPSFDGYYIEGSYYLTGENRVYVPDKGIFDRTPPLDPFSLSGGGWGAWQVAGRMSNLDLTDSAINGGEIRDYTLALKWTPVANVMMSANYIQVDTDNTAVTPGDDPQLFLLRTQFDF